MNISHWNRAKVNEGLVAWHKLRKCFFVGGNSTRQSHIRSQHYSIYEERCKAKDIPMNHWTIPNAVKNPAAAAETTAQTTLNGFTQKVWMCPEFSPDKVKKAVIAFVVCDNQVSHQQDINVWIHLCWTRPWLSPETLPSEIASPKLPHRYAVAHDQKRTPESTWHKPACPQ